MSSRNYLPLFALVAASFLFGTTFVVVKEALDDYPVHAFIGWRFLIGGGVLTLLSIPGWRSTSPPPVPSSAMSAAVAPLPSRRLGGKDFWLHGWITGGMLFCGYSLQTAGLEQTSASNSALITGLFVVFTPLLAALIFRRFPSMWVVLGSLGAFIGVGMITYQDDLTIGRGDLLTIGCALCFAAHIVAISSYARQHLVIPFTACQLMVVSVLAFLFSFRLEDAGWPPSSVWGALFVTGLLVSAGAILLQIWAQTRIGPGPAAITLSLEPIWGVAAGSVILNETFSRRGWVGAALIVVSVIGVTVATRTTQLSEGEAITPAH